jgi:hypothetical protein
MRNVWKTFGIIAGSIAVIIYALRFVLKANHYESDAWNTLARTNTPDGGYCFVRQQLSSFLFSDVGFGYVDHSGTQYSYPLQIDGFHWNGARLIEKNGDIHVRNSLGEAAIFNLGRRYFTNLIIKHTFAETNGLSHGVGSSFFELDSNKGATH